MMTIVGLAQNFVGSNNLNLLQPLGQFGTRLHGGKDSASPRYIFTMLRYVHNFWLCSYKISAVGVRQVLDELVIPKYNLKCT